ncbi:ATP-binding protein [Streptomyces sp. LHD-70]|uniref:ATP-binding protein n=1 Tax=Streptomyces sp. LHD-70 TaxID=3072140 RepID=UPI00280FDCDE|nr:ATP-binding protein [Streptomyces sp. LHD-70]MDQ8707580.1 ATP-binding protein [Streptomyces sp. LHD-70]
MNVESREQAKTEVRRMAADLTAGTDHETYAVPRSTRTTGWWPSPGPTSTARLDREMGDAVPGDVSELLRGLDEGSAVVAIGAAGSGKSTAAAAARALGYTVISLDELRREVSPRRDAGDQSATRPAVAAQNALFDEALSAGKSVYLDSTNVEGHVRAGLIEQARRHGRTVVALRFLPGLSICQVRNAARQDSRRVPEDVLAWQYVGARNATEAVLLAEGFTAVHDVG